MGGRDGPATRDTAQLAYSMQPFASGPVPHSRWLMGDKYQNDYDKSDCNESLFKVLCFSDQKSIILDLFWLEFENEKIFSWGI